MKEPKVAFFDIDHTVIKGSTGRHFLTEAFRRKLIPFRMLVSVPFYYFQYRFMKPEWENWSKKFTAFSGISYDTIVDISQHCFDLYKDTIFPQIELLIRSYKEKGIPVYFATSSVDLFVEPFMSYFDVDGLLSSKIEFIDSKTSGGFLGNPAFGSAKLKKVQEKIKELGLSLCDCAFYSDSIHDRPLLEACANPVAVNPDKKLEKLAKKKGWLIIEPSLT